MICRDLVTLQLACREFYLPLRQATLLAAAPNSALDLTRIGKRQPRVSVRYQAPHLKGCLIKIVHG